MRKAKLLLFFFMFIGLVTTVSFAEVINNAPGKITDPFIIIGERMAQDGIIWASAIEGKLVIEARFITKLSPQAVIKIYSPAVNSKIERFSNTDPVWKWMGDIGGEEKHLTITYSQHDQSTIIEVASFENVTYKKYAHSQKYRFLGDMEDELITSKETFNGDNSSSLYMYDYPGMTHTAVRYIQNKLKAYGWQDMFTEKGISEDDQAFHVMEKENERVGIVAVKDDDGTTILTLTFHQINTQNEKN